MKSCFLRGLLIANLFSAAVPAMADTPFVGIATQLETGYSRNSISRNIPSDSLNGESAVGAETGSVSASGVPVFINPEYTFALGPQWRLGAGVDHQFIPKNTRRIPTALTAPGTGAPISYYEQVTDETNVFIAPGMVIDSDKLVFFKLGYSFESIALDGKDSKAKTAGGFVIGVGYQQVISGHFFGTIETHYSRYTKLNPTADAGGGATLRVNTGAPSVVDALVGLGYRF